MNNLTSKPPRVSVLMPFYNCEKFIESSVKSILEQSYDNFELILINDNSTDNSEEVLRPLLSDKRIIYVKNTVNKGIVENLNNAIDISTGEIIARMDGDDLSMVDRFEKQINFLDKNPDIHLVGTFVEIIDSNNNPLGKIDKPISPVDIKKKMLLYSPFIHPTIMIRKETLSKIGHYRSNYGTIFGQDIDLYYRLIFSNFYGANIPEYLVKIRHHQNNSVNYDHKVMAIKNFRMRKETINNFNLSPTITEYIFIYGQLITGFILNGRQKQKLERFIKKLFVK